MINTSEYVYDNIKLNETRNFLQTTINEYEETYGYKYNRIVKVECFVEFYDKIKKEKKFIIINRCNIIGELIKIMQKSRSEIKLIKINEVNLIIEGRIKKNIMEMYFKSGCMPTIWKKFYGRGVNKKRCLYNKQVNRNEKHFCHFNER